jgi:hypothetical protein
MLTFRVFAAEGLRFLRFGVVAGLRLRIFLPPLTSSKWPAGFTILT